MDLQILENFPLPFSQASKLPWLDQPGAKQSLQKALNRVEINDRDYQLLDHWREFGYCIVKDLVPESSIDDLVDELARLFFLESPVEGLKVEGIQMGNLPTTLSHADVLSLDFATRKNLENSICRIHAFHERSIPARAIFENQHLRDIASLIIGKPCLPQYSISFMHGTDQALHEDMAVFYVYPANHLVGVWIALEDISEEAGPLIFYPESHKDIEVTHFFPDYPTVNLRNIAPEKIPEYQTYVYKRAENYSQKSFIAKKGEILFWHGMLIHGGGVIQNPALSRKSMVIHFITESCDWTTNAQGPFNW